MKKNRLSNKGREAIRRANTFWKKGKPCPKNSKNSPIDLLKGLSNDEKILINKLRDLGFNPIGLTYYTDTNEVYYFGKLIVKDWKMIGV